MIHPWQPFSAHGSTTDVAHMRYTLIQRPRSQALHTHTASDVMTNFWYDVIFIVTVYTSQGYRPEWEHRGDCLYPYHVL